MSSGAASGAGYDSDGDVSMGVSEIIPSAITEVDFNEYTPIFILSHGGMPQYKDKCLDGKDASKNKILDESGDDIFTTVPKNMIVVDPIIPSLNCMDTYAMNIVFPDIIEKFGNNAFLKGKYSFTDYIDNIYSKNKILDEDSIHVSIKELYNKTKIYYPTEATNNLAISFTNDPKQENRFSIIEYHKPDKTMYIILGEWTKQYHGTGRHDCVFLKDIFALLVFF